VFGDPQIKIFRAYGLLSSLPYPALVGFLFEGDQSTAWRDIRRLKPFVKECVPIPDKIGKIGRIDELLKLFLDLGTFADAAIEEIPMPKDKQKRKDFYSGKKKRHTVKTQTTQQERADSPYKQER